MFKIINVIGLVINRVLCLILLVFLSQNMVYSQVNTPLPTEVQYHNKQQPTINKLIVSEGSGSIDQSVFKGNFQILIYNTDDKPDDIWRVVIDKTLLGNYEKGKSKWWDLQLTPGKHEVIIEDAFAEDRTGNYSIWFGGVSKIKGPPTENFNASEQQNFIWEVEIPD